MTAGTPSCFPAARAIAVALAAMALAAAQCRAAASAAPPPSTNAASAAPTETPAAIPHGRNLLANGDFASGSGKSPDHWRTGGWNESPSFTRYDWTRASGGAPELVVTNLQSNDARWLQSLSLGPGWYYVGAQVRTEDVPAGSAGAYVSLDEDGINSSDLHGDSQWQRAAFYLKVGAHGADVDIALRLGGFGRLNTGRAFFREARVIKLGAPPAGAEPVFDLRAIRRSQIAPPVGKPWTLPATFILLAILAIGGWYVYGAAGDMAAAGPADARPPAPQSGRAPRGERRRRSRRRRR